MVFRTSTINILVYLWVTGFLMGGCSSSRSQQQDLFKDYRKKLELQKAALAKEEEKKTPAPEVGAKEHERFGDLYLRQGNMELAFLQYDKALRMDSSQTSIRYKLGRLFLEKGMYEDAGSQFQEILRITPGDALALEGMGRVYFRQARFAEAESSFRKAIDLRKNLWQAHHFLGIILDRRREFERAISHYRSAIALNPNSSMLYNNLGISLLLKGDFEEAVRVFTEALTLENSNKKIHNNLALALSKSEKDKETSGASGKDEDEASAYRDLGNVPMREGKVEEGNISELDTSVW